MGFPQFKDQGPATPGTPINAANLNVFVVAQTHLMAGGIPNPGSVLKVMQPETHVVINTGREAIYVSSAPQELPMKVDSDNYVDLTRDGQYVVTPVDVGVEPPPHTPHSIRLYRATTSGGTVIDVTQLATTKPIGQHMIE